jgi:hypothetical protein
MYHPEQPVRLLADDPDIKPRHFDDVISTGKLLSPNVYFQIEMENKIGQNMQQIGQNMQQMDLHCIENNIVL